MSEKSRNFINIHYLNTLTKLLIQTSLEDRILGLIYIKTQDFPQYLLHFIGFSY